MPFVVKDNIFTKGLRTTFGSKLLEHDVPEEDSICLQRLRAAGGVLVGKTNTPEFAHDVNTSNAVFGTTRNPWQVNCTADGSSGGTGSRLREDLVLQAVAAYAAACPQHFRRLQIDLTMATPLGDAFASPDFVVR